MSAGRKTWGMVKDQIGQPYGLCGDNPRLLEYFNEGCEYFWGLGYWVGSHAIYRMRIHEGCRGVRCITLPREIETVDAMNVCGQPIGVRNLFFQFIQSARSNTGGYGPGTNWGYGLSWGAGIGLLGDRQEVCTSEDIHNPPVYLRAYTERIEDSGYIILLGYDENRNWIRTQDGDGNWRDGVYLSLANLDASGITSIIQFSAISGVQFTDVPRKGNTYLYSIDGDGVERQLATYDYSVEIPVFRRSVLAGCGWGRGDGNRDVCVTALCRMRFMPVMNDTDYVQISSVTALKSIIGYVFKRDAGKLEEAEGHKMQAIEALNSDLRSFNGAGAKKILNLGPRQLLGAGWNVQ